MVDEVILHIGMHKTGSSSIQRSLYGYDDGRTFYARFPERNHSAAIRGGFSTHPERYHQWRKLGLDDTEIRRRRGAARAQLAHELARTDRHTLIISGEGISLLDDSGKHQFLDVIQQFCDRVRVVCYIRHPLDFAASYLQEIIKSGARSCPSVVKTLYRKRLDVFVQRIPAGDLIVRPFDRSCFAERSVVADFCNICELDTSRLSEEHANESLSAPALKLVYAFNRSNQCYSGDRIVHQARLRLVEQVKHLYASYPAIEKARFAWLADFTELDYLRKNFGLRLAPPDGSTGDAGGEPDEWLADPGDIDLAPLISSLQEIGVNASGRDAEWLMNRLFYQHVGETAVRHRQVRLSEKCMNRGVVLDFFKGVVSAGIRRMRRFSRHSVTGVFASLRR